MLCRSKVSWCLVSWGKWAQFLCAGEDTSPLFPQGCSLPRFSLKAEKLELLWNNPPGLWCLGTEVPRATTSSTQFPRLLSGGDRWICCSSYKKDLWDVPGWSTGLTDTKPFQGMGFLNAPQRSSGCLWGLFLQKNTAQNTLWAGIICFLLHPKTLGLSSSQPQDFSPSSPKSKALTSSQPEFRLELMFQIYLLCWRSAFPGTLGQKVPVVPAKSKVKWAAAAQPRGKGRFLGMVSGEMSWKCCWDWGCQLLFKNTQCEPLWFLFLKIIGFVSVVWWGDIQKIFNWEPANLIFSVSRMCCDLHLILGVIRNASGALCVLPLLQLFMAWYANAASYEY